MPFRRLFTLHLVALCVAATAPAARALEEGAPDPVAEDPAAEDSGAILAIEPTVDAIEDTINGLSHPVTDAQLMAVLTAIGKLRDEKEQERLRQALTDRGHALSQAAATAGPEPTLNPESSDSEFRAKISALQLGPQATVEDLRARDEVVSAIVGVSDPTRREALLKELETRERQAETLVEPAKASQ
jgi:hypothetical protein